MKLIDRAAVVAEIENIEADAICEYNSNKSRYAEGGLDVIHRIKHLLDALEVKEVDLEKEIDDFMVKEWEGIEEDKDLYDIIKNDLSDIARHFFELGMQVSNKTQKEE